MSISYQGTGSGQGRTDFANKVVDFAGTDAPYAAGTAPPTPFLYFPTVVGADHGVVQPLGRQQPEALGRHDRQDLPGHDHHLERRRDQGRQPEGEAAEHRRSRWSHRSDGSGTTQNFTKFLMKAAPATWTLGTGSTVQWPASTQGAQRQRWRRPDREGHRRRGRLRRLLRREGRRAHVRSIKNAAGKYIAPTTGSASAALRRARRSTRTSPTTRSTRRAPKAYPITSPTWIIVYANQTDAKKGAALKAFLNFVLGTGTNEGQNLAKTVDYAPLPKNLLEQGQGPGQQDRRSGVVDRQRLRSRGGRSRGPAPPVPDE